MNTNTATATARKIVSDQLATIGVAVPARLLQVKGGRVVKVYLADEAEAAAAAAVIGGTVKGSRVIL